MTDKIVVVTTCASAEEADRIASALVEKKLAACVNICPGVTSVYRWKDEIERSSELMLFIKTNRALLRSVEKQIETLHSYELPEAIALTVVDGSEGYLLWLDESLAQPDPEQ